MKQRKKILAMLMVVPLLPGMGPAKAAPGDADRHDSMRTVVAINNGLK